MNKRSIQERLSDRDICDGVVTHWNAYILECEVKIALGIIATNKATRCDGIPGELFKILKDDGIKELHSIYQQIWKTQQWQQDWQSSVFIPIPKEGNVNECTNDCAIVLIPQDSKVMFKIFQARLKPYVNWELPVV